MMKKAIVLLFMLFSGRIWAQQIPDGGIYKVRISGGDRNIIAEVKPVKSEPSLESDRLYNWYSSNQIRQTQGGYSGKLLNGQYSEFYPNKNLKEKGYFNKGLKDGIWKSWDENGTLVQQISWVNGIMHGEFSLFDEKGNLKQKGTYGNGLLNGKQYTYSSDGKVQLAMYKQGKVVPENTSPSFWSKINIFKKRKL